MGLVSHAAEVDGPPEDWPLPDPDGVDGSRAFGDRVLSPPGVPPPEGSAGDEPEAFL